MFNHIRFRFSFIKRTLPAVVFALRRRRFAFLVCAAGFSEVRDTTELANKAKERFVTMRKQKSAGDDFKVEMSEGLLLFYDRFSFYSQKVVMALHEKNLPFDSKIVNLIRSEQYKPWFLYLNPRGEVPVLQDTGKIIPDSARIIDYLEDNFSNGDTPRLIPMDQGPEIRQNVNRFRHILQSAPEGILTSGAMIHQHLLKNPKTPFIGPVRKALANADKNGAEKLRSLAEKYPEHKEILLNKAKDKEEKYKKICDEKNFMEILDEIHSILDEVEKELKQHKNDKQDWWLCSDRFTIADVELTILLVRISQLGLEHVFWTDGKRPYIEKYYERVKQRDSYKKTVPGTLVLLKTILMAQAPLFIGVVAAVALVVGGAIIAKKYI